MLVESERPATLSGIVGRDKEVAQVKSMIAKPDGIPHLILSGKQGTGKTAMAVCIANEVLGENKKANFFEYNASSTRGIEFIRSEIADVAGRRVMGEAPYKIIMMDEADNITPDAQMALRRIMEVNHKKTRFIFTANYPYKLIPPLLSRCVSLPFDAIDTVVIAKHLKKIATKYKLEYSDQQLIQFAKMSGGDMRMAINNLEGNVDSATSQMLDGLTLTKIKEMNQNDKIGLSFSADPEYIFGKLWEMVQKEKAWDKLLPLSECNFKMNNSIHKTLFIANLLENHF